jgi:hypothetical protein
MTPTCPECHLPRYVQGGRGTTDGHCYAAWATERSHYAVAEYRLACATRTVSRLRAELARASERLAHVSAYDCGKGITIELDDEGRWSVWLDDEESEIQVLATGEWISGGLYCSDDEDSFSTADAAFDALDKAGGTR